MPPFLLLPGASAGSKRTTSRQWLTVKTNRQEGCGTGQSKKIRVSSPRGLVVTVEVR